MYIQINFLKLIINLLLVFVTNIDLGGRVVFRFTLNLVGFLR